MTETEMLREMLAQARAQLSKCARAEQLVRTLHSIRGALDRGGRVDLRVIYGHELGLDVLRHAMDADESAPQQRTPRKIRLKENADG